MKGSHQISLILSLICLIAFNSCKESKYNSDSELINRVNEVQEQMMIQGNVSEEERQAILSLASLVSDEEDFSNSRDTKDVMAFDNVENSPIYPGCEGLSPEESKACFIESIDKLVKAQFNTDLAKDLKILEPQNVEIFFKIDKNGNMSNFKVRDANVIIQAEVVRVIKKLPLMKPGTQNGEPVDVMCSTTITYGG